MSKTFLHVGCGVANPDKVHITFRGPEWREVRLDIDPGVKPDVVASMTDMAAVESGSMDGLYSSHNLEHLYPHDVPTALREFVRVLRPDGFALLTLPDLQRVAELVAADKLEEAAYVSPAGPIAPLDILFGFRPSLAAGNLFMAHRTGFTATSLAKAVVAAGFARVQVKRVDFDLWAMAHRTKPEERPGEKRPGR
jgi:ubiquinone/menaquinone biosynthesis C-methylase UbiE